MATKSKQLWDVVIVELGTGKVEAIVGKAMKRSSGFHNAVKREHTVLGRINENYTTRIVPSGKFKVGDVIEE